MRPGREIDTRIAQEVFGHKVWVKQKTLFENPETGERPLRSYSKEIEWAMAIVEKMKMTLIPIMGGQWFVFAGPPEILGWASPQDVFHFLESKKFQNCGAGFGENLPLAICEAALKATEKRNAQTMTTSENVIELPQVYN